MQKKNTLIRAVLVPFRGGKKNSVVTFMCSRHILKTKCVITFLTLYIFKNKKPHNVFSVQDSLVRLLLYMMMLNMS